METGKIPDSFLQQQERKTFIYPSGSHSRESGYSSHSRILDNERAEMAALIQHAERLCAAQKTRIDAILERMGLCVQQDTFPSPQPLAYPQRRPAISRGRRIRPIQDVEENSSQQLDKCIRTLNKEDPFFEKKLRLGSHMAVLSGKLASLARSPSPDTSISSADTHTPDELRALSKLGNFSSSPPPTKAPRGASCIPVMSKMLGEPGKEVAPKCRLQQRMEQVQHVHHPSPRPPAAPKRTPAVTPMVPAPPTKVPPPKCRLQQRMEQVQHVHHPSPRPPAAPKRTPAVTPIFPAPPTKVPPPKPKGPRCGKTLRPQKAGTGVAQEDLQPLANPLTSMSLCFSQLSSENWEAKLDGFKSIQSLARHHRELLLTKLHEVCLILEEEVANLRSVVACGAINTIADLHVQLGQLIDSEAERTGRALLLKLAQTTNAFIHQQVNLALDALVQGCSPCRIMNALLNTGFSHRCAAVRASTAQHLHQLAVNIGEHRTLAAGKVFAERFLNAVGKMSVDAAPEVRHHGLKMLEGLAYQKEFQGLWNKLIPAKDRFPLDKILKKSRR